MAYSLGVLGYTFSSLFLYCPCLYKITTLCKPIVLDCSSFFLYFLLMCGEWCGEEIAPQDTKGKNYGGSIKDTVQGRFLQR